MMKPFPVFNHTPHMPGKTDRPDYKPDGQTTDRQENAMMTEERLEELKRLAVEATPGPWEYDDRFVMVVLPEDKLPLARQQTGNNVVHVTGDFGMEVCKANAAFIAAANPSAVLELVERAAALEREAEWLAKQLAHGDCPFSAYQDIERLDCPPRADMCYADSSGCWRIVAERETTARASGGRWKR